MRKKTFSGSSKKKTNKIVDSNSHFYLSWFLIAHFLNLNVLITIRLVNKQLREMSYDPSIWKQNFKRFFSKEFYNLELKKYQGDKSKIDFYFLFQQCYEAHFGTMLSVSIQLFSAVIESDLPRLKTCLLHPHQLLTKVDSKGFNPLFFAIKNKDQKILDYIYSLTISLYCNDRQEIDVNKRDKFVNHTILHWATYCNQMKEVQYLLSIKADANVSRGDSYSDPPLHFAALGGFNRIAELLLEAKADPDRTSVDDGINALYIATETGHTNIVKLLIDYKADTNLAKTADGITALHIAVQNNRFDEAKLLLNHGAKVNSVFQDGIAAIHLAAQNGFHDILQELIEHKANINIRHKSSGATALFMATQNGHRHVTNLLLNNKAIVNICRNNKRSPLYNAIKNNDEAVIEDLLEHKADINIKTKNGISIFKVSKNPDILKLLEKAKRTSQLKHNNRKKQYLEKAPQISF